MDKKSNCVLLADRHHGLRDSVRGLLETQFDTVFMVATEAALLEGAGHLNPEVVVVDLSLSSGDMSGLLAPLIRLFYGKLSRGYVEMEAQGLKRHSEMP